MSRILAVLLAIVLTMSTGGMNMAENQRGRQARQRYGLNTDRYQRWAADQRGIPRPAFGPPSIASAAPAAATAASDLQNQTFAALRARGQSMRVNAPRPAFGPPAGFARPYDERAQAVSEARASQAPNQATGSNPFANFFSTLANRMAANNGQAYASANPWANTNLSPRVNPTLPGGAAYNLPNAAGAPDERQPAKSATAGPNLATIGHRGGYNPNAFVSNEGTTRNVAGSAAAPVKSQPKVAVTPNDKSQWTDAQGNTYSGLQSADVIGGYLGNDASGNRVWIHPDGTVSPIGASSQVAPPPGAQFYVPPGEASYTYRTLPGGYSMVPFFNQLPPTNEDFGSSYGGFGGGYGWGRGGGGGWGGGGLQRYLDNLALINWTIG